MTYAAQPDGPARGARPHGATTTMWFTAVIRGRPAGGETIPRPDLEPIFTELARQWEMNHRRVVGRTRDKGTLPVRHEL